MYITSYHRISLVAYNGLFRFYRDQSQTIILSANQTVLYTWDDPTSERTLMWNVYGRNKPNYPAAIAKVCNNLSFT